MIIYKTTCLINGKVYIGQQCDSSKKSRPSYIGSGTAFKDAIKKYGKKNFICEAIEYIEEPEIFTKEFKKYVGKREDFWIEFYNARNKEIGYNIAHGGNTSQIGNTHRNKRVYKFDLKGNFIEEYESIKIAGKINNISLQLISFCCYGQRKAAGGFVWRYDKNDLYKYLFEIKNPEKEVYQFDLDGNFIAKYASCVVAANATNLHKSSIARCGRREYKTYHGFIWKYADKL